PSALKLLVAVRDDVRARGRKSNQRVTMRARLGLANQRLFGKPFVLGPTNRALDPCKKDRHDLERVADGNQTDGAAQSRLRTSDHNGAQWPLLLLSLAHRCPAPVKII